MLCTFKRDPFFRSSYIFLNKSVLTSSTNTKTKGKNIATDRVKTFRAWRHKLPWKLGNSVTLDIFRVTIFRFLWHFPNKSSQCSEGYWVSSSYQKTLHLPWQKDAKICKRYFESTKVTVVAFYTPNGLHHTNTSTTFTRDVSPFKKTGIPALCWMEPSMLPHSIWTSLPFYSTKPQWSCSTWLCCRWKPSFRKVGPTSMLCSSTQLVGGFFPTHLKKNAQVKLDRISPAKMGVNIKISKLPPPNRQVLPFSSPQLPGTPEPYPDELKLHMFARWNRNRVWGFLAGSLHQAKNKHTHTHTLFTYCWWFRNPKANQPGIYKPWSKPW